RAHHVLRSFPTRRSSDLRLRVGSAFLTVTQPRMPCYKLGIRFGRLDMVRRFLASGRSGFYLAVHEEGDVAAGDPIELLGTDHGLDRKSTRLNSSHQIISY